MTESTLTAIIVEDSPQDMERLLRIVQNDLSEHLTLLGAYNNVGEAALAIKRDQPDLVFLDIHVGNENGLHLIRLFEDLDFEAIVITSDLSKSTEALELSAIDFIHKPLREATPILQVINRLKRGQIGSFKRRLETYFHNIQTVNDAEKRFTLRQKGADGPLEVLLQDILRVEASRNYSNVYTTLRTTPEVISRNMGYFEKILPQSIFIRANRSNLVNAFWIKRESLEGQNQLVLKDDSVIPVSAKRWGKLVDEIRNLIG